MLVRGGSSGGRQPDGGCSSLGFRIVFRVRATVKDPYTVRIRVRVPPRGHLAEAASGRQRGSRHANPNPITLAVEAPLSYYGRLATRYGSVYGSVYHLLPYLITAVSEPYGAMRNGVRPSP